VLLAMVIARKKRSPKNRKKTRRRIGECDVISINLCVTTHSFVADVARKDKKKSKKDKKKSKKDKKSKKGIP
jgi:hypothetical protein